MSGLRINYSKSEVFMVGCDGQTSSRIARLTEEELSEPAVKVERRLETWKCGQLSFGGEDGPSEYQPY
jgi:hypothetical protein